MLNTMSQWLAGSPRRMVQGGLAAFFGGTADLLVGLFAQLREDPTVLLADRFPGLPTWWVPEGPAGFALATTAVCWGVWAMGSALRFSRGADAPR